MIEMEFMLGELERLRGKEKGLRARNHLDDAIAALKKYYALKNG